MRRPAEPRLSFEPLLNIARGDLPVHTEPRRSSTLCRGCMGDMSHVGASWSTCWTDQDSADLFDTTRRTVQRWRRDGVPISTADKLACRLGRHPIELWSQAWESGA